MRDVIAPAFSRRLFLGGIASLGVASTVKTRSFVPTIYGDMIHDDAPGLNALFRGDPVRVLSGRAIQGECPALVGGRLLLGSPLEIEVADTAVLANAKLTAAPGFRGDYLIYASGGNITLSGLYLDLLHIYAKRAAAPVGGFVLRAA